MSVKEKELIAIGQKLEQECNQLITEIESIKKKIKVMITSGRGDYLDWLRNEMDHFSFELKMFKHNNDAFKEVEQLSAPMAGRNPDPRFKAGSIPAADTH